MKQEIDKEHICSSFNRLLFENGELRLSLKEIAPDSIKAMLPDKTMVFKRDDLHRLLGLNRLKTY